MHIVHKAGLVTLADEAELAVLYLLVGGDVQGVVVVAVAVHVVGHHVGVVVTATPSLIDQTVVVAAVVVTGCRQDETVGGDILRVVQLDVVGTLDGGNIGEGTLGSRAGHTGHLLVHGVCIGSHQAQPVGGLGVQGHVGNPAITAAGVLQDEGLGAGAEAVGIDGTVVGAVKACEACHAGDCPVADAGGVDVLVEDTLDRHGEGERHGDGVVYSQRGLPYHRHLEVGVHSRDGAGHGTHIGSHILGIAHSDELAPERIDSGLAVSIGHQAAGKLAHVGVGAAELCLILDESSVGGHVGEEHQGQTTREQSRTATQLERLVAEHVPSEAHARLDNQVAAGPLAGVDVTHVAVLVIIVQCQDGVVGHQVAVVKEQSVQTQAVGQLEVAGNVPLVLCIDAGFVELHACSGLGLAAVAVGQAHDLGSGSVDKVIDAVVAVVARTVAHVLVVGHLMFKGQTAHHLVVAIVPGNVVAQVPDGVVHGVIPGEQLIAQRHVVVAVALIVHHGDVDEGELARVAGTHVIQLGVGGQELVGEVFLQAAVQVQREGVHQVVHAIHRVGKREGLLRHASRRHALAAVHRRGVGVAPVAVLGVVVAQGQVVVLVDVPVQAGQQLIVVLIGGEAGIGTGLIAILLPNEVAHASQVGQRGARDILVGNSHAVGRGVPAVHDGGLLGHFTVDKEEQLVLEDRAADGSAIGGHLLFLAGSYHGALDGVTTHVLVAVEHVCAAAEGVGTALGDGVHTAADEVGLTHVKG